MLPSIDEINQWIKTPILKIAIAPLTLLLSLIFPDVRQFLIEHIQPSVPPKTLWILWLIFAYLSFLLLLSACVLRKEIKELHSLTFKFGVYWDSEKNAYCPHCKKPLVGYTPHPPTAYYFWCHTHRTYIYLHDDAIPISLEEARKQL
jgi:hypothetical protein